MSKLFGRTEREPAPEALAAPADPDVVTAKSERDAQRKYGKMGRSGTVLSQGNKLG
jgi:hypothetical protein